MTRNLLVFLLPALFLASSATSLTVSSHCDPDVSREHQSRRLPTPDSLRGKAVHVLPRPIKHTFVPLETVRVTSGFGLRKHPILKRRSFHNGIDFAAKLNDKVKSISDGIVTYSGARGALGNAVFVSHPKWKVTSIYGHLNRVAVRAGDKVSAGRLIGYAGTTGRSTGVHLHLTVKDQKTGANVEPAKYLKSVNSNTAIMAMNIASPKPASHNPPLVTSIGNHRGLSKTQLETRCLSADVTVVTCRSEAIYWSPGPSS